jgi:aerobic carbon-monoxide dehydrogenase medium subunit
MYPARIQYVRAGRFGEACAALDAYGEDAKALAGGQTLIPMMKLRLIKPRLLVDLGEIDGASSLVVAVSNQSAPVGSRRSPIGRLPG